MSSTWSPTSRLTALAATMCSLPGKPMTSDMRTEPPFSITRSAIAPITVLPATAVVQSDPPHCTPTTRPPALQGTRSCAPASAWSFLTIPMPLASASGEPPSCWIKMPSTGLPELSTAFFTSDREVCSHPSPTSNTP